MTYRFLLYDVRERVATITINRPEKLNAISFAAWDEIKAALAASEADADVGCVILAGAGRSFCVGADLSGDEPIVGPGKPDRTVESWVRWNLWRHRDLAFWRDLTKPTIAAVQGHCIGWAFEIALSCDMIVAAEDAQFSQPEVRQGSMIASQLAYHVGPQKAKEVILTGDPIDAAEAKAFRMLNHVVPKERLMEETFKLARRVARAPYHAAMFNKLQVDALMDAMGFLNGTRQAHLIDAICHHFSPETVTAFGEKLKDVQREKGAKAFLQARDAPFPKDERPFRK
jgi:enoyl-CoA hydratase